VLPSCGRRRRRRDSGGFPLNAYNAFTAPHPPTLEDAGIAQCLESFIINLRNATNVIPLLSPGPISAELHSDWLAVLVMDAIQAATLSAQ